MSDDKLDSQTLCVGLAPVVGLAPTVLILGSMPGRASIDAVQYYAHRANRFWPLMARLFPKEAQRLTSSDYEERLEGLKRSGVALWDTIGECERTGSLDSAIRNAKPNAILAFLTIHPTIKTVVLNGRKSEDMWKRYMAKDVAMAFPNINVHVVPSTSPANAALKLEDLEVVWSIALN